MVRILLAFLLVQTNVSILRASAEQPACAGVWAIDLMDKVGSDIDKLKYILTVSGGRIFLAERDGRKVPFIVVNNTILNRISESTPGITDSAWLLTDKEGLKQALKVNLLTEERGAPVGWGVGMLGLMVTTFSALPSSFYNDVLPSIAVGGSLSLLGATVVESIRYAVLKFKDRRKALKNFVKKGDTIRGVLAQPEGYLFDSQAQEFLAEAGVPIVIVGVLDQNLQPFSPESIRNPDSPLNRSLRAAGLEQATEVRLDVLNQYIASVKPARPDQVVFGDINPLTKAGNDKAGIYIERLISEEGNNFDSFKFLIEAIQSQGTRFSLKSFIQEASSISVIYAKHRDKDGQIDDLGFRIPVGFMATGRDMSGTVETRFYLPMADLKQHQNAIMDGVLFATDHQDMMSAPEKIKDFAIGDEVFVTINNKIRTMQRNAAAAYATQQKKLINPEGPTRYMHEYLDLILDSTKIKGRESTTIQDDLRQLRDGEG